jgi:hypothetical protein
MIPKEQYVRANGMMSLAESGSGILAPVLAGALYTLVGLGGIMLIDIVSFIVAVGALFIVHIPQPEVSEAGRAGKGSLWKESIYGFRYIFSRPSLLGLQLMFFFANLTGTIYGTLLRPMILSRDSTTTLGVVEGVASAGAVVGGVLLSTWGGPKRRVHGVLMGIALSSVFGGLVGFGRGIVIRAVGSFLASFFIPLLNGSNQAIWQAKVAPDVQGRVFATRRLIAQISAPVSMMLAGVLADKVFEPAMREGGSLAAAFGGLVGTGPGAGMALLIVISGVVGMIAALSGYLFPAIRYAEDILPDHDAKVADDAPAVVTEVAGA